MKVRPTGARYCDCGRWIKGPRNNPLTACQHCREAAARVITPPPPKQVSMSYYQIQRIAEELAARRSAEARALVTARQRRFTSHNTDPAVLLYRAEKAKPARVTRFERQREDVRAILERAERAGWQNVTGWGNRFRVDRTDENEWVA